MSHDIKPCPHCAGNAELWANYNRKINGYFVFVKCSLCGAQGRIYMSRKNPEFYGWDIDPCLYALESWNQRITVKK